MKGGFNILQLKLAFEYFSNLCVIIKGNKKEKFNEIENCVKDILLLLQIVHKYLIFIVGQENMVNYI